MDLQITGDTARGAMAIEFMGRETKSPLEFRRIDGGWLIHQSGQIAGNPLLPQGWGPEDASSVVVVTGPGYHPGRSATEGRAIPPAGIQLARLCRRHC